jgi:hypothetical protein
MLRLFDKFPPPTRSTNTGISIANFTMRFDDAEQTQLIESFFQLP